MGGISSHKKSLRNDEFARFYLAYSEDENRQRKGKLMPERFGKGLHLRTKSFKHVDGQIVFVREKKKCCPEDALKEQSEDLPGFLKRKKDGKKQGQENFS